ncbi:hypothetical protein NQ318_017284 [Aromia moschata]|uniref:Glyceraldehyde 3-phosphate dehydrogenase NAD(P) binding domain-containing protein n=1 Tax=Aromia moschata TaxID=1265417 RepID=A0AAV8XVW3_9CUCU|nr:hypothetical protein NQ318_017284 [Aromia moschata]
MAKIGINGYGRLGRLLLRVAVDKCKGKSAVRSPMVVMINDPHIPKCGSANLIKKDSFQGGCCCDVKELSDGIMIDGLKVEFSREDKVEKIPWTKYGVDYIIDTTWQHTERDSAKKLATPGIKRVMVTGCKNIPMFVFGVNHACFKLDMKLVSAASPSTNCLATMLSVLHEYFGVENALATTLRPFSNYYRLLDDPTRSNVRDCRASINCMAPTEALSQGHVIGKIMPELDEKTETTTIRVPVTCVGAVSLAVKLKKPAPLDVINLKFKEAAVTYMKGIIRVSEEELVSNDVISDCHSCVMDLKTGKPLSKCAAQLFAWYDAEYAFASRLYDLAQYISSREDCK